MHYRKRKAQYHLSAFSSAISIYLLGNTFRSVGLSTGVGKGVVMMSLPVMNVTPPRTAPFPPDSTTRQHHRSSRSTSGRYASYWNAFLFPFFVFTNDMGMCCRTTTMKLRVFSVMCVTSSSAPCVFVMVTVSTAATRCSLPTQPALK